MTYNVSILVVGATGLVGTTLLKILLSNGYQNIRVSASGSSTGKQLNIDHNLTQTTFTLQELSSSLFDNTDVAFFCSDTEISKQWIPIALKKKVFVIDNSSAFRLNNNVPLVIPEINKELIHTSNLIANPNCSTAILCMALYPLLKLSKIVRVDVSTYQAVSGAGKLGVDELNKQCSEYIIGKEFTIKTFNTPIFGNCFSHNSSVDLENGYNEEELKIIYETKKILNYDISISATCIRVPVFTSHTESVKIVFEDAVLECDIDHVLSNCDGVEVIDNRAENKFPEPFIASGRNEVFVGRIRRDYTDSTMKTYHMLLCGDQLLKGASWNAFQIFEEKIKKISQYYDIFSSTNNNQK